MGVGLGGKGSVQQEHMQGRAPTLMFAGNVNQDCKFAQDPNVKYTSKYLQDQTLIAQPQRGQYSTYSHIVGVLR